MDELLNKKILVVDDEPELLKLIEDILFSEGFFNICTAPNRTRALELAMEKFPNFTYSVILGFVLGSIIEVFPGLPQGLEYLWCAMSFAGGWLAIWLAGRLS